MNQAITSKDVTTTKKQRPLLLRAKGSATEIFKSNSKTRIFRMGSLWKLNRSMKYTNLQDSSFSTDTESSFSDCCRSTDDEYELDAKELLGELKTEISKLFERRTELDHQIDSTLCLAMARRKNGSTNPGVLVPLRQMANAKNAKAATAAARFDLILLRQQIMANLIAQQLHNPTTCSARNGADDEPALLFDTRNESQCLLNLASLREDMKRILAKLESATTSNLRCSDEELLAQLGRMMG